MNARDAILRLLAERASGKTICPSEAARAMDPEGWRGRMDAVRAAGAALAAEGRLVVSQRGERVPPDAPGAIRYGAL